MVKRIVLLLLVFVLALTVVSAIDTPIVIKTAPYHEVKITVSKDDVYSVITRISGEADADGKYSGTFSADDSTVTLYVQLNWAGEKKRSDKYEGVPVGEEFELEFYPSGYTPKEKPAISNVSNANSAAADLVNESVITDEDGDGILEAAPIDIGVENEAVPIEPESNNSLITGNVVAEAGSAEGKTFEIPKYVYYIFAAVVAVALLLVVMMRGGLAIVRGDPAYSYKKIHSKELEPTNSLKEQAQAALAGVNMDSSSDDGLEGKRFNPAVAEIEDAEKEIALAEEKIRSLKSNEYRIATLEKRIADQKAELDKLRRAGGGSLSSKMHNRAQQRDKNKKDDVAKAFKSVFGDK